jgi:hypothetical protein
VRRGSLAARSGGPVVRVARSYLPLMLVFVLLPACGSGTSVPGAVLPNEEFIQSEAATSMEDTRSEVTLTTEVMLGPIFFAPEATPTAPPAGFGQVPLGDLSLEVHAALEEGPILRLIVTNEGTEPVSAIAVEDTLSADVVVSASTTGGTCDSNETTVTCGLGTLDPNDSLTVTIRLLRDALSGELTNTARLSAETGPSPGPTTTP